MIKLQKGEEILEASTINIYPEYTEIVWGDYKRLVSKEQWIGYSIIDSESNDEKNDNDLVVIETE